jgi:hypothetical protein
VPHADSPTEAIGVRNERQPRLIDGLTIPLTVVIALFVVKLANPISYDPDLYWHLKTGEYIVSTWSLPHADMFSHTAYGRDWVLHEWLTEVLFYAITQLAGLKGLWAFVAALYAATFLVLYRLAARLIGNPTHGLVAALLFFAPFVAFATPRPQVFTYLLFASYLWILAEWKYAGNDRSLKLLPLIMLAWVNLHGAAIVGVVLVAMFLVTEGAAFFLSGAHDAGRRTALKKLAFWGGMAALATIANPRLVDYWLYPFYVMNLSVATSVISEWQSPDFHLLYYRYFLALFFAFFAVQACSRRRPDLTEVAVPMFFLAAGFTAVRHLPLACIAALPFFAISWKHLSMPALGRVCSLTWLGKARLDRQMNERCVPYLNLLLLFGVAAAMLYQESRRPETGMMEAALPVKAADFVASRHVTGRMFNEYSAGGYLLYRLYPGEKVFIDGRADMYGDDFLKEYLAIATGGPDWREKFDRHAIDYAILPRELPLRQLLLADGGFRLVHDDEHFSVLVRDTPQFRGLPSVQAPASPSGVQAGARP